MSGNRIPDILSLACPTFRSTNSFVITFWKPVSRHIYVWKPVSRHIYVWKPVSRQYMVWKPVSRHCPTFRSMNSCVITFWKPVSRHIYVWKPDSRHTISCLSYFQVNELLRHHFLETGLQTYICLETGFQ